MCGAHRVGAWTLGFGWPGVSAAVEYGQGPENPRESRGVHGDAWVPINGVDLGRGWAPVEGGGALA